MIGKEAPEMPAGTVVEFFESKDIVLGVCLNVKDQRLSILTETNREMNLARRRVIFASPGLLDPSEGRDQLVQRLLDLRKRREDLAGSVRVEELWEVLEGEPEGFAARDLAELYFSGDPSDDHVAALQRVLLRDRLYFQYKDGLFVARTADKVEQRRLELEQEARREALLEAGAAWLKQVWKSRSPGRKDPPDPKILDQIKDFCLFGQEAPESAFVKELFKRAGVAPQQNTAFRLLVQLGIWSKDENLYLHQQGISSDFSQEALEAARQKTSLSAEHLGGPERQDLRHWDAFTVDGANTRDFDDALSLEKRPDGRWLVGVHIADAAQYVQPGDPLDREAEERTTSIYLPDARISMLPAELSEDLCSLRLGEDRLAVSFLFEVDEGGTVHPCRVVPSLLRVKRRLTYEDVDRTVEEDEPFRVLHGLAQQLRQIRLARGAVLLPLPEIQIHVNEHGMIHVSRYEKETPGQLIVSEWMIAANGLAANELARREIPAIYRTQEECRPETDQVQSDYPIFHVYRQRRLFARAELTTRPGPHCSLGMDPYTTVTSPIRRYMDLVVQRQLKHALQTGEALYGEEELEALITRIRVQLGRVAFVQRKWARYWLLKYLEQEDIQSLNALVLDKNARFAHLLIPDFLMEVNAPLPEDNPVSPGEMVRIKIERLVPRDEIFRVQIV
ncbi:exoribonuclease-2 [Desulfacinum hydrothermale DSM 13146]|uniref:Exoribonuclease-2 n=1 Tax=Desulfacinum hydrothermale DSM 13146 TaxID=1121390 RepID=A0A1W1XM54_9BACT|nr:ribonuclease catalytic domain-containing protein [Desulfacinum hydrothermale]SMC24934.1 exoribonuclease-2 [Desulfacinum hydrothermale DSM 13146]